MGKEKDDEIVLVVPRDIVVPRPWYGIKSDGIEGFERLVRENMQLKRRGDIEDDPRFKQIIPYMVFKYENRFFLMQRTDRGGDERLHNLYSLGIGGHIREEDLAGGAITTWAGREFEEEIDYNGSLKNRPLGLLNDDSNEVGKVHLGYVILLDGNSDQIQIRDEHQSRSLQTLGEMLKIRPNMETWSQLVYDFLKGK